MDSKSENHIGRQINWLSSVEPRNLGEMERLQRKMEAYYLNQTYYDDITPGTKLWSNLNSEPIHRDIAQRVEGKQVLEIGCGRAEILSTGILKTSDYTGCDFSPELIAKNANRFPDAKFKALDDGRALPFDDVSFDAVFSLFVLEHAVFPADFLDQAARVLRPGGTWILLCPDFLGCDRMTSQRVGFSLGSGQEKLKMGRLWDALVTSYDQRIRVPRHCRKLKEAIGAGKSFYVNTAPVCFAEKEFRPDVDAVYLTYVKEIIQHLKDRIDFLTLSSELATVASQRRLIYLVGQKSGSKQPGSL